MVEEVQRSSDKGGRTAAASARGASQSRPVQDQLRAALVSTWVRMAIAIFAIATLSGTLGLSASRVWAGLLMGVSMLIALRVLCALCNTKDPLRNRPLPAWGVPAVICITLLACHWVYGPAAATSKQVDIRFPFLRSSQARTRAARPSLDPAVLPSLRQKSSAATPFDFGGHHNADYWEATVACLHRLRFDTPDGQEPSHVYYSKRFNQLAAAVTAAKNARSLFVDDDLRSMAEQHLREDEIFLAWVRKVRGLAEELNLPANTTPVNEQIGQAMALIVEPTEEEFRKLPVAAQEALAEAVALEEVRLRQLEEIKQMQQRLRTRSPWLGFLLPKLNWEE